MNRARNGKTVFSQWDLCVLPLIFRRRTYIIFLLYSALPRKIRISRKLYGNDGCRDNNGPVYLLISRKEGLLSYSLPLRDSPLYSQAQQPGFFGGRNLQYFIFFFGELFINYICVGVSVNIAIAPGYSARKIDQLFAKNSPS